MKVLIASDTYYPHVNGASYFTQRLAQWLISHGHNVHVIAPSPRLTGKLYQEAGVSIQGVPSFSLLIHQNVRMAIPLRLKAAARKVIREFSPDVVHIQDHFMVGRVVARVARQMGLPLVGTNHFMPENLLHYLHLPVPLAKAVRRWAWRDFRRVFRQADVITTPTKTAADLLHDVGLGKEVQVLSCGIDRKLFQPREARQDLLAKWKVGRRPYLLYVGRLDREKNIDLILRALARLAPARRPTFLVAGRGAEEEGLEDLTRDLGIQRNVQFLGFVPNEDLPALYNIADAFVIAGIAELQSLVTLEAMASGLPIIAVNAMALPELVHPGKNGFLFELGNEEELARHIKTLMSDERLRETMGRESLRIVQVHDLDTMGREYEKIYEAVIQNHFLYC